MQRPFLHLKLEEPFFAQWLGEGNGSTIRSQRGLYYPLSIGWNRKRILPSWKTSCYTWASLWLDPTAMGGQPFQISKTMTFRPVSGSSASGVDRRASFLGWGRRGMSLSRGGSIGRERDDFLPALWAAGGKTSGRGLLAEKEMPFCP